jgi:uncharacterized cupin superfamily protein
MDLWPGYYLGKFDKLQEPILTEIPKMKIDIEHEPDTKIETVSGNFYTHKSPLIRTANGVCSQEDFGAGETFTWMFPYDEFHWIVKGSAEMTYSLAGTSHTEQKTVRIKPGDIYLLPTGARVTWKIDPGEPLRHICIVLPGNAASTKAPGKAVDIKK